VLTVLLIAFAVDGRPVVRDASLVPHVATLPATHGPVHLVSLTKARLTVFTEADGLSGREVRALALDVDTLWVGTERGLSRVRVP